MHRDQGQDEHEEHEEHDTRSLQGREDAHCQDQLESNPACPNSSCHPLMRILTHRHGA